MIYFTRGWASGELSDEETDRIVAAYQRRMDFIEPSMPAPLRRLARDYSLHDAVIDSIRWTPSSKRLSIDFIAHAGQGFKAVSLTYFGAQLGHRRIESLQRVARDRSACVHYDEVDIDSDGKLIHRLLFLPTEEVTLEFDRLELQIEPRTDQRIQPGDAFLEDKT